MKGTTVSNGYIKITIELQLNYKKRTCWSWFI